MTDNKEKTTSDFVAERHRLPTRQRDRFFAIRNTLNTLFFIGALAGMATYTFSSQSLGTKILIASVACKFVEVCLRLIKTDKTRPTRDEGKTNV